MTDEINYAWAHDVCATVMKQPAKYQKRTINLCRAYLELESHQHKADER